MLQRKRTKPYEKLKFYQDICIARRIIYKITERFKSRNYRLVSQMRDSARSAKQNTSKDIEKAALENLFIALK